MSKAGLILTVLILAAAGAFHWAFYNPPAVKLSPAERNRLNQRELVAALDRYVLDEGRPPTGPVKTYLPDGQWPTNPWTGKPAKLVSPAEEYGAGDFMLVPAAMTFTIYSYEGEQRKLQSKEKMQGYWLVSFGEQPLSDAEGYRQMLDEDWEFIKSIGLKNVVALLRISDTDMPGGYRVELEKFPAAWLKAVSP